MDLREWKNYYESEDFKNQYECPGERFGALYYKDHTTFRVWAPDAKQVALHLYATGTEGEEAEETLHFDTVIAAYGRRIPMDALDRGIFECTLMGDLDGVYYTYEIIREYDGCMESTETVDPYAVCVGANGYRGMVVDLEETNPLDWDTDNHFVRSSDSAIIYELHVKDFSNDPHSGISEENRGKYLAFTEENTTVDSEGLFSSGINYLKELGITHVHLLPTYDFGSVDELGDSSQFNWGYDPVNYRVPEGSYSSDPRHGEVRIFEFKQMVKALHEAGIGVILDMVFNHTFSNDSPLNRCVPFYYYRQREDGSYSNGSGCGNETASERAMFRNYIIDTVLYLATEYHIDGFRFDLMGVHDNETMNQLRDALNVLPKGKNILIYGEPWAAEPVSIKEPLVPADKAHVRALNERVAIFHDGTRDAIKGSVFETGEGGFVNGTTKDLSQEIKHAVLAWCDTDCEDTPLSPKQVISYVSAHDNYTLWDKLTLTMDPNKDYVHGTEQMLKANQMIAAMIQMSLGTPFFQAGEEFARTKLGEDNSYCSSAELNQLDWRRRVSKAGLVDYYKGLIQLRKMCSIFSVVNSNAVKAFSFDRVERDLVSYTIRKTGSFRWSQLYVVFYAGDVTKGIKIPEGEWQLLVDDFSSMHYKNDEKIVKESANVSGHSVLILGKISKVKSERQELEQKLKDRKSMGGKKMDLFARVTGKIADAGKYASEVVKDTSEMISLKNQISTLKKENKTIYEEIGRKVYAMEHLNQDSKFAASFAEIDKNEDEATKLQQRLDLIKDSKHV